MTPTTHRLIEEAAEKEYLISIGAKRRRNETNEAAICELQQDAFIKGALSQEARDYHRQKQDEQYTKVLAFLEAHLQWEAYLISDDKFWWPNVDEDVLRGPIYNKFLELQELRNDLLSVFREQQKQTP